MPVEGDFPYDGDLDEIAECDPDIPDVTRTNTYNCCFIKHGVCNSNQSGARFSKLLKIFLRSS